MADEKNIQEKYMQFQMVQQHLEQITEYVEQLQLQQREIGVSIEALKELEKAPPKAEVLAPITNGIFFKAELKDNKNLLVNVGADVTVEKNIPEVIGLLEEQQQKMSEKIAEAERVFQELQTQGLKMYQEIEEAG